MERIVSKKNCTCIYIKITVHKKVYKDNYT